MKKVESYRLKQIEIFLKAYIKMEKKLKFGDIEIEEQKFYQYKIIISITNIDINKIVVSNKVSFSKKCFQYFIDYKHAKTLDLHAYFFQK